MGNLAEIGPAGDGVQFEQGEGGDGISGWFGAVVIFFAAEDEVGGVRQGFARIRRLGIVEAADHGIRDGLRPIEGGGIEGGFIEINQAGEKEGIGVEQLDRIALAVVPAMVERLGLGVPEVALEECGVSFGGDAVGGITEDGVSSREGTEHQTVPGGEDFVVPVGAYSLAASMEESGFGGGEQRLVGGGEGWVHDAEDILVGERLRMTVVDKVALRGDAKVADDDRGFGRGEEARRSDWVQQ